MKNNAAIIAYNALRMVRRFAGKAPGALCGPYPAVYPEGPNLHKL